MAVAVPDGRALLPLSRLYNSSQAKARPGGRLPLGPPSSHVCQVRYGVAVSLAASAIERPAAILFSRNFPALLSIQNRLCEGYNILM